MSICASIGRPRICHKFCAWPSFVPFTIGSHCEKLDFHPRQSGVASAHRRIFSRKTTIRALKTQNFFRPRGAGRAQGRKLGEKLGYASELGRCNGWDSRYKGVTSLVSRRAGQTIREKLGELGSWLGELPSWTRRAAQLWGAFFS